MKSLLKTKHKRFIDYDLQIYVKIFLQFKSFSSFFSFSNDVIKRFKRDDIKRSRHDDFKRFKHDKNRFSRQRRIRTIREKKSFSRS